jgi:AraC family transcriptional regulator of adaptative response/methylated-DNA-[protein]-cysteine methyltransferase
VFDAQESDSPRPIGGACWRWHEPMEIPMKRRQASTAMAARMEDLCAFIASNPERATLAELARRAHMSPSYLQRRFRAIVGVSPRRYAEECRMEAFRERLRSGDAVTDAVYAAGFGSPSRVYERVSRRMGMTPGQYRKGGDGLAISYATTTTPVGLLLMAATDRGLCDVRFGEDEAALHAALVAEFPAATITSRPAGTDAAFDAWMDTLRGELDGTGGGAELPLDIRGSAFRMRVWDCLQRIPRGQTRTYREVAEAIGRPDAVRAVAGACAANRVALAIPCHRVIRGDGGLGGYRWGVERKRQLLDREGAFPGGHKKAPA